MKKTPLSLILLLLLLPLLLPTACYVQLTLDQKMIDFQGLAALFSKHYAFLEWKHNATGFDGLQLAPWIDRIKNSKDDLEFFEICTEHVAACSRRT